MPPEQVLNRDRLEKGEVFKKFMTRLLNEMTSLSPLRRVGRPVRAAGKKPLKFPNGQKRDKPSKDHNAAQHDKEKIE